MGVCQARFGLRGEPNARVALEKTWQIQLGWWTGLRCDSGCPRSGHLGAWPTPYAYERLANSSGVASVSPTALTFQAAPARNGYA